MHPLKDESNISPPKGGYTYSLLREQKRNDNSSEIEDFLKPKDIIRERSSGYSVGHVRTLLGADSYGPKHSATLSRDRLAGKLPFAQNKDLNFVASLRYLEPEEVKQLREVKMETLRMGMGQSASQPSFSNSSFVAAPRCQTAFGNSVTSKSQLLCASRLTNSHSVTSLENKSLVDPRTKGSLWHDSYAKSIEVRHQFDLVENVIMSPCRI